MFVGHLGAGLALQRAEPRLNVGVLVGAALFADLLLWVLVLAGIESVGAPGHSGAARYFTFVFPWSHGLVASVAWSVTAALLAAWTVGPGYPRRAWLALVAGVAVYSHFALDFVVHVDDLPVTTRESARVGLGLWNDMPIALAVELLFSAAALWVFVRATPLSRARRILAVVLIVVTATFTAAGPYLPGDPPPAATLAASSLATLLAVVALAFVVDGRFGLLSATARDTSTVLNSVST
jgi:hypothetical protein